MSDPPAPQLPIAPVFAAADRHGLEAVGLAEASALLGIRMGVLVDSRRLSARRRGGGLFSRPVATLACRLILRHRQILAYQHSFERGPKLAARRERLFDAALERRLRELPLPHEEQP